MMVVLEHFGKPGLFLGGTTLEGVANGQPMRVYEDAIQKACDELDHCLGDRHIEAVLDILEDALDKAHD